MTLQQMFIPTKERSSASVVGDGVVECQLGTVIRAWAKSHEIVVEIEAGDGIDAPIHVVSKRRDFEGLGYVSRCPFQHDDYLHPFIYLNTFQRAGRKDRSLNALELWRSVSRPNDMRLASFKIASMRCLSIPY